MEFYQGREKGSAWQCAVLQMQTPRAEDSTLSRGPRASHKHAPVFHHCRSELLGLLKTYNCYHEGRSFQLRHREVSPWLLLPGLSHCVPWWGATCRSWPGYFRG